MVLPFAPESNGSDPCIAVDEYNDARPPRDPDIVALNIGTYVALTAVHLSCLLGHWLWREKPRFVKVRPFFLSAFLVIGTGGFTVAVFLSYAFVLPCAVPVLLYQGSVGTYTSYVILRLVTMIVEASYAKATEKENTLMQDEQDYHAVSTTSASFPMRIAMSAKSLALVFAAAYGVINIRALTIYEIVDLKNSIFKLALVLSIPSYIVAGIIIAVSPALQTCVDCDAFLEVPIAFVVSLSAYMLLAAKHAITAFRLVGWDDHDVLKELIFIPLFIGPVALAIWGLIIADPDGIAYRRVFNWSYLFLIPSSMWVIISFVYQFWKQYRRDNENANINITDMNVAFSNDETIRKEFMEFAARQFITESVQFLEDVKTYKTYFFDKGENWRILKFKAIVDIYVQSGAKKEINISHSMRSIILQLYANPKGRERELFSCFDSAVDDVRRMVRDGAWTDFLSRRSKQSSRKITKGIVFPALSPAAEL